MSGQPGAAEWEYLVEGDLAPHLITRGRPGQPSPAGDNVRLPAGAQEDIAGSLGPVRPEDLVVIPAAAWPLGGWRRRCLYSPLCVAAVGEKASGLWVRDLPLPQVRARVAFDDIALIEHRTAGSWHALTVTARTGPLVIRYADDQGSRMDAWTRRLRQQVASPGALIIEQIYRDWRRPWRKTSQTLYLPRQSVCEVTVRRKTLRLESAGTTVRVRLASRGTAATAAKWLAGESPGNDRRVAQ
jgi:hypothetical protein